MISALIIEDEELSAKRLLRLLKPYSDRIEITHQFQNISETVSFLSLHKNEVDLIFLDIHLADGQSFEIFEQIKIDTPIIFTTAYNQYALAAFRHTSIDYLTKPIQEEDLNRSMEKFFRLFQQKDTRPQIDYQALAKALQPAQEGYKKRFLVQAGAKIRSINIEDVALFYAQNKACYLITQSGRRYDINFTLEKVLNHLNQDIFFRVNRKVIVKIDTIQELYQYSKSRYKIELNPSPGFDVFISTDKLSEFKKWMNT